MLTDDHFILFSIIPLLAKGVIIHFHDICYPFEYPIEWVEQGISWNEAYLLKAFLMYNSSFKILVYNHYIFTNQKDFLSKEIPYLKDNFGGSLWLKKLS